VESTSTSAPTITATNNPFRIETSSIKFEGQEREHLVFIPDDYTDTKIYPLVIFLHGYGGAPQGIMEYTQFNQV